MTLNSYIDQTYQEMIEELGAPADKTTYTIGEAPTKGWNHRELFARYPKNADNQNIQIMEVTWDLGKFYIMACYHVVEGTNRCLVAKKIKKGVRF